MGMLFITLIWCCYVILLWDGFEARFVHTYGFFSKTHIGDLLHTLEVLCSFFPTDEYWIQFSFNKKIRSLCDKLINTRSQVLSFKPQHGFLCKAFKSSTLKHQVYYNFINFNLYMSYSYFLLSIISPNTF